MLADDFTSELARELAPDALDRFLRYVQIDTQSAEDPDTFPSTERQLDLLRRLVEELQAMGIEDAALDEHGYVMATIGPDAAAAKVRADRAKWTQLVREAGVRPE